MTRIIIQLLSLIVAPVLSGWCIAEAFKGGPSYHLYALIAILSLSFFPLSVLFEMSEDRLAEANRRAAWAIEGRWTSRVPSIVGHYWVKVIQAQPYRGPQESVPFPVEIEECGDGDVWMFQLGKEDTVSLTPGARSSVFRFYTNRLLPPERCKNVL